MLSDRTTNVEMSELQAERFIIFQKYFEPINQIIKAGALEIKNGSATLHFSPDGTLSEIEFNIKAYKRGK